MISSTPNSRSESRGLRIAIIAAFVILVVVIAILSANPDPYNADVVANFISMLSGYGIPGNTIYLPAHSNATKLPWLWLAVQLFGYSNAAVGFTDVVDTIGFYGLTLLALIWAFRRVGRVWQIVLACLYLLLLSPLWYWYISHPDARNIEIGAGLLWVVVVLISRKPWHMVVMVLVGSWLLIGDPWILTTYFVPAILAVFIDTLNHLNRLHRVNAISLISATSARTTGQRQAMWKVWRDLMRVVVVAAAVIGISYLIRRIANASGLFFIVNTEGALQVVTPENFSSNVRTTLESLGSIFNMWVPGRPMIGVHVIRALGNGAVILGGITGLVLGLRNVSAHLRRLSLFALISSVMCVGLFVFSNLVFDLNTGRYMVFVPVAVIIGLILLMMHLQQTHNVWRYMVILILASTIAFNIITIREWLLAVRDPNFRAPDRQITQAVKALQADGVTYGFADYWESASHTFQLNKASFIAPVICGNHRLLRYEWLSQRAWYEPSMQPPIAKSFVLVDHLRGLATYANCTRDDMIAQFGPPAEVRPVEYEQQVVAEILIWNENISSKLTP